MEQQGTDYGIPYAMAVHDIERLEKVYFWARNPDEGKETPYRNIVNIRLSQGWKVMFLGNGIEEDPFAIMGVPRPKHCMGAINNPHKAQQVWDNERAIWVCPECGA